MRVAFPSRQKKQRSVAIEILAHESTSLGPLCLRRRELVSNPGTLVTEVTLNHEFLMSSYLTESERALSRIGVERFLARSPDVSRRSLRSLVGGLGLGYTAAELLNYDTVGQVEVVEFLPQVIGWLNDGLTPLAETIKADDRLVITGGDIYQLLAGPVGEPFDLIVIDVDHSPEDVLGEQSKGFYSVAGLTNASRHLKEAGVMGVWSYAEDTPFLETMRRVFPSVEVEKITVWNDLISEEQTDWLYFGQRD